MHAWQSRPGSGAHGPSWTSGDRDGDLACDVGAGSGSLLYQRPRPPPQKGGRPGGRRGPEPVCDTSAQFDTSAQLQGAASTSELVPRASWPHPGFSQSMDHDEAHGPHATPTYPPRRLLPPHQAQALEHARYRQGPSLGQAARLIGIDYGHLGRLCRGERCQSGDVAERLIWALDLGPGVAEELRAVAVDRLEARSP